MLSQEAIREFKTIYCSTYGIDLSIAEATELATHLIRFYKLVLNQKEMQNEREKNS